MVNFMVALTSEARPLIEHYKMSLLQNAHGFQLYTRDSMRLVITGMGKVHAAAGTAYLASFDPHSRRAWLNVGIAGHHSLAEGTFTFAQKITDQATKKSWYPPQIIGIPGVGAHITTYDEPVTSYPGETVCEMEASAYYAVATRFSPGEVVQCCKIISDNRLIKTSDLTPQRVEQLVGEHVGEVDSLIQSLSELAKDLVRCDQDQPELLQFIERWHFTISQKVQLREALRKLMARNAEKMLQVEQWQHCGSAKHVLSEIERYLKSQPVTL